MAAKTPTDAKLLPASAVVDRFRRDLDALAPPDAKLGLGVSGGPDSLALLLLAAAARPGLIEAATVDHALRDDSRKEADMVAAVCKRLGVPHAILTAEWKSKPTTAIQERARGERYRLLGKWAKERKFDAFAVAHQVDDQAETVMMRLARGSGVQGLAAMRRISPLPGSDVRLLRPLLGWSRLELEQICSGVGLKPVSDPSNQDQQFERVRVREALTDLDWLQPTAIARSAAALAAADAALHWATSVEWGRAVSEADGTLVYRPEGNPAEIRRRIVHRALLKLASEGRKADLRGHEIDRLLGILASGRQATLRGVICSGGEEWRFAPAPVRKNT
jgi:tRNA(Ile)-lysidine synthase